MSDHFAVDRGELVAAPKAKLGWFAGLFLGLFTVGLGGLMFVGVWQ
ncbi:hypothetical protein I0Q12_19270 [Rhodococcus sp. CX]|nr:hypothetical protein [Rhodococcus sp. CX]MBH0121533.1 hypothetical protein [Rhodococcus sp. CX]